MKPPLIKPVGIQLSILDVIAANISDYKLRPSGYSEILNVPNGCLRESLVMSIRYYIFKFANSILGWEEMMKVIIDGTKDYNLFQERRKQIILRKIDLLSINQELNPNKIKPQIDAWRRCLDDQLSEKFYDYLS